MAEQLGMTVGELRRRMPYSELVGWWVYFARRAQREQLAAAQAREG